MTVRPDETARGALERVLTRSRVNRWQPLVLVDEVRRTIGVARMERIIRSLLRAVQHETFWRGTRDEEISLRRYRAGVQRRRANQDNRRSGGASRRTPHECPRTRLGPGPVVPGAHRVTSESFIRSPLRRS